MDEQGMATTGATWQRMAVWLARAGYGDLEYSTVTTLQRLGRSQHAESPAPVLVLPALLTAAAD